MNRIGNTRAENAGDCTAANSTDKEAIAAEGEPPAKLCDGAGNGASYAKQLPDRKAACQANFYAMIGTFHLACNLHGVTDTTEMPPSINPCRIACRRFHKQYADPILTLSQCRLLSDQNSLNPYRSPRPTHPRLTCNHQKIRLQLRWSNPLFSFHNDILCCFRISNKHKPESAVPIIPQW